MKVDDVEFYLQDLKSKFDKIDHNDYVLSYSGGKDSHFLYWFIKEYLKDDTIKIVSVNTTMEHPQILDRINKNADHVLLPVKKPLEIKEQYGIPCYSKIKDEFINRYQRGSRTDNTMKFINGVNSAFRLSIDQRDKLFSGELPKISNKCCYYLKKQPLNKFAKQNNVKYILGVRGSDSMIRKFKYTSCFTKDMNFTPIHDLTDELMDKIYDRYNIELPPIYNTLKRTGCMGCPYGRFIEDELETLSDNQYKYVVSLFEKSYNVKGVKYRKLD